jgi:FkbM family methyltransferase
MALEPAQVRFAYGKNRYVLRFPNANDHIAKLIRSSGSFYERALLTELRRLAIEGVYVDGGAHVGNHTLFFAHECPSSKVVAVEVDPTNFDLLRANTSGSPNVELHRVALVDSRRRVSLRAGPVGNSGMGRVLLEPGDIDGVPLSGLVSGPIGLLKLDIEGSELLALHGASSLLESGPVLVIEAATDVELSKLRKFLAPLGYRIHRRYGRGHGGKTPTYIWRCR